MKQIGIVFLVWFILGLILSLFLYILKLLNILPIILGVCGLISYAICLLKSTHSTKKIELSDNHKKEIESMKYKIWPYKAFKKIDIEIRKKMKLKYIIEDKETLIILMKMISKEIDKKKYSFIKFIVEIIVKCIFSISYIIWIINTKPSISITVTCFLLFWIQMYDAVNKHSITEKEEIKYMLVYLLK